MRLLNEAIEKFSDAAERLDAAVAYTERRTAARADGAEAQGDVILRLRGEIESLKQALADKDLRPTRVHPAEPEDERIEPFWAAG